MGRMSFFLETPVSLNTEIQYRSDNTVEITIPIVSPDIKLGIPLGEFITSRMIGTGSTPGDQGPELQYIQYKIDRDGSENGIWQELSELPIDPRDSIVTLLDISLTGENVLKVSFKEKNKGVFLIIHIEKRNPIPMIGSFISGSPGDPTIARLRSLLVRQIDFQGGFSSMEEEHIGLSAVNVPELVFYKQSVYPDSSILYRLILGTDTSEWRRTGHFCQLDQLKSDRIYAFEVKYDGSDLSRTYVITVSPKWHEKTSSRLILILIMLLIAAATSYFILRFKWNREQKRKTHNLLRLKAIRAQLNPHFIFNALSTIQGLINMDKKVQANQYLTNFSDVLRHTLTSGDTMLVSLVSELELLKNYLDIEQLRFQFAYNISIDPSLNINEIEVPPMLLQPSIENAIKHGGGNKGKNGWIKLTLKKEKDGFHIEIFDNGLWTNAIEKGYGLALTEERIAVVNELSKERKIMCRINRSSDGTAIRFIFENWLL